MDGDGDLSAFLAYLRANRGLSDNTVKAYGTDVRECLHALASRGIADLRQVTTDDLRGWMAFETRDHARSSMARKVVSVRSFFAWAHEHGRIEADPAAVLMTPKLPDTLPSVLTEAQAERLMDRVDDDASLHAASSQRYETRHDEMPRLDSAHRGEEMSQRDEIVALRDAAMLELLYATGIRVAELVGLDIGDVDWSHRTIRVTGKGSKQRVVPCREGAGRLEGAWPTIDIAQSRCGHSRYGRVVPRHARPPHRPAHRARCRASRRPRERGARYQPAFAAAQRGDAHAGRGSGPARGSGDARPFVVAHHAAVHACVDRAAEGAVPPGVSPGLTSSRSELDRPAIAYVDNSAITPRPSCAYPALTLRSSCDQPVISPRLPCNPHDSGVQQANCARSHHLKS